MPERAGGIEQNGPAGQYRYRQGHALTVLAAVFRLGNRQEAPMQRLILRVPFPKLEGGHGFGQFVSQVERVTRIERNGDRKLIE